MLPSDIIGQKSVPTYLVISMMGKVHKLYWGESLVIVLLATIPTECYCWCCCKYAKCSECPSEYLAYLHLNINIHVEYTSMWNSAFASNYQHRRIQHICIEGSLQVKYTSTILIL